MGGLRAGGRKRRFGISIPEALARDLDELAEALSTDRSRLVGQAIRAFIQEHKHHVAPHFCLGLFVVVAFPGRSRMPELLEEFRDVVQGYNHFHTGGYCIEVVVVSGFSERIKALHTALLEAEGCSVRYLPLAHRSI
ncbi:CopG family transcriptional regulator [Candidatus Bathyarchaeota archaeon]|nr:MAG: CopG family transcriptional regulator [Candidatus Bathyarchaeota archaeon]